MLHAQGVDTPTHQPERELAVQARLGEVALPQCAQPGVDTESEARVPAESASVRHPRTITAVEPCA